MGVSASRVPALAGAVAAALLLALPAPPHARADERNPEPQLLASASAGGGLVAGTAASPIRATVLGGPTLVPEAVRERAATVAGSARRVAGADRYATSVSVSRSVAPSGAREVVLATGEAFADALSAAPLAAELDGPLLLTARARLPAAVATELRRLAPTRITVVGGEGAVASATVSAARAAAGGDSVRVRRLAGTDRYATSVAVAALFGADRPGAVLASGETFPDGVSAGPVAAALRGPLLLTPRLTLHPQVRTELARLSPDRVVVAGGTGAVGLASQLGAESATGVEAERAAGTDRYATSSALARVVTDLRPGTGAWVATGTGFADALVGGVGAAAERGPVLLTPGRGPLGPLSADLARVRGVGTWLQLSLDAVARQQQQPPTVYVAYDAAYRAASLGTLYGWDEPEAVAQLQRLRTVRKADGGYGMERAWDAFGDGSVNPASTSYLISVTDHAGVGLVAGLRAGAVPASEVAALVDLVVDWPRVVGDDGCLAYSMAPTDRGVCVYNVNSSAAWFLQAAWDAGVRREGQQQLAALLYAHDAVLETDGWWPYSSNRLTTRQDWNHNAAMIDFQFQLDVVAGQASLDSVMPGGWVHPDPALASSSDVMGYMRLLPHACEHRGGVPEAARALAAAQWEASATGQLALWAVRTTASCGE